MKQASRKIIDDIYEIVSLIPYGRVTTYGSIAKCLGWAGGSRAVGWALKQPYAKQALPTHRVVNRLGILTGKHHFSSLTEMQERLEAEGILVENDKVVNFEKLFWNPAELVP